MDDGELLRRTAAKDLEAFKALVERYQNRVLGLCSRLLRHPQNAEDVAQEVFFQAYKSAGTFRHDCRVSSWIYRIAVNRCLNFNRDHGRFKLWEKIAGGGSRNGRGAAEAASDRDDPAAALTENEMRELIRRTVAALPERQKAMIILNKFEGRSYQEIAHIMNVSVASVESCLHRAKLNLQQRLALHFPTRFRSRKSGTATRV